MEELRNAAHMVVRDPTGLLSQKEQTSTSATSSSLFPSTSMPGQEALMTAFQAAFFAMRSVVPTAPASQQAATSETPRKGEFQNPMSTETGSSLVLEAESEMDVITSDTGVDVVEGDAAKKSMLEFEPEQERDFQTPVLPIDTSTTKKSELRGMKADQKKSGKKPSKRQRMSFGEKESATPTADTGVTGPESTQVAGIVVVETESPPATLSRRNTPVRQSAQAARFLLSNSRSKKKEEETFSEEETRKGEENK